MTEPQFRAARADDLAAIVAMLADDHLGAVREVVSDPPALAYHQAFDAIASDPNQLLAVAEIEGEVVGCLQISFLPGLSHQGSWRGEIESVRIAAHRRGGGLGRRFILWAVERCRERGCRIVQLTTDQSRADAQRFYATLGFEATHVGMKFKL